jgi:hypothetical protein
MKVSGYHRQARAENVFFRYKSIIGEALRARSPRGQLAETLLACNVLNQMDDPRNATVLSSRSVT